MSALIPLTALALVASALTLSAALQLAAPAFVERTRQTLQCPRGVWISAGFIELFAVLCLIVPETRVWGIAAAFGVITAGMVIFFCNGRLLWCLPALILLAALVPAALAL